MAKTLMELDAAFQAGNKSGNSAPNTNSDVRGTPEATAASSGLAQLDQQFRNRQGPNVRQAPRHRKFFSAISNVIFYALMLLLVVTAFLFAQDGHLQTGKFQLYYVMTTSMDSVYPKGSLLLVRAVDPNDLRVGNDITFYRDATTTITHRIVEIHENNNDTLQRVFRTKGVDNPSPDSQYVPASAVAGKVVLFVPQLGALLWTLQNKLHLVLIFFVAGTSFSFFLNMTLGETRRERKLRKAKKVLKHSQSTPV